MGVDILDATDRLAPSEVDWLADRARAAVAVLRAAGHIRVRVIDDQEMAAAHLRFAGVEGTTDVLTFDLGCENQAERVNISHVRSVDDRILFGLDTDISVCLDEGRRQAGVRGYPVEKELLLYIVHGVLHCLGWDDHDEAEAAEMHELEDAVLEAIGVGAAFRTDGSG